MLTIQPWSVRANDGADLAALQAVIAGETLDAVRYVVPHGENWPEGHRGDLAHEVDMAVELVMASGSALVFSWAMDGFNEGLAVEFRDSGELEVDLSGDAIEVSAHVDWVGFLGESIVGIIPAWHVPNEGCPEMPWSFRVEFSNKSTLVIALGEANGPRFAYLPDALVVIFDKQLAISYQIPASVTSAYG